MQVNRLKVDVPYEEAAHNQSMTGTPQWTVNGFIITVFFFVDSCHEEDENQSEFGVMKREREREKLIGEFLHHVYDKVNGMKYINLK